MSMTLVSKENIDCYAEGILELYKQWKSDIPNVALMKVYLNELINKNGYFFYVEPANDSENKPVILGAALLVIQNHPNKKMKSARIEDVMVSTTYRRLGIATSMMRFLVSASQGCYKIELNCDPSIKALYENVGFTQTKEIVMRINLI